jgi:ubiquinone/menaquinone biosynthesis C-methylase UbiE
MPTNTAKPPSPPPAERPYVLGTGQDETFRLGLQHRLWSASAHALWEKARVQPGNTVLDIGCGPGHASLDLAQIVGPKGRVIAVDESAAFLKQLHDLSQARRVQNIERVLGDAQELDEIIEGGAGAIDVAYARWVFCFVPDPEAIVRGLVPLLRRGGRVAIQDYFNYERSLTLAPRREAFSRVIQAIAASWRSRGGDTDVMGKLPGILHKHGLRVEHMDVCQRVARPGSQMWHWPESFWGTYLPKLVETGFISEEDRAAFLEAWHQATHDPASFVQLPPVYELIAIKD